MWFPRKRAWGLPLCPGRDRARQGEHNRRRVRVLSPQGEALATIGVDANITNAAFGGAQRKTLYLTGAGAVWSIELDVAGLPY